VFLCFHPYKATRGAKVAKSWMERLFIPNSFPIYVTMTTANLGKLASLACPASHVT
jgi:hypothetical protein